MRAHADPRAARTLAVLALALSLFACGARPPREQTLSTQASSGSLGAVAEDAGVAPR